jgi:REP element-mobilizing transposase RayT
MPRPLYIPHSEFPYHVTARSHNKQQFSIPLDDLWQLMCSELFTLYHLYDFRIHNFVLMPNHFHMIVTTPNANLPDGMCYFMTQVSKSINNLSGNINQNFGARHYKCLMPSYHYYLNAYKYVYRNPVKAKLCQKVEDYKYSSIQMYLGQQTIKFPLTEDSLLMNNIDFTLSWLNSKHDEEDWASLRGALRKGKLILPKNRLTREPHKLETNLL